MVERTVVERTVVEKTVVERTVVETTSGGKHLSPFRRRPKLPVQNTFLSLARPNFTNLTRNKFYKNKYEITLFLSVNMATEV